MKGLLRILTIVGSLSASAMVAAAPITIVSQADTWNYNFGTTLGPGGAGSATLATFTANYTGANTGQAAFGNTNIAGAPVNTVWAANTALYAQTTVNLAGALTGPTTLNVAVDNGAAIWINGNLAFQATAGGFTTIWEYTSTVANSFFISGLNTVSVIANDYGGATYFDMQLTGDISAVPEPSLFILLSLGLAVLGFSRSHYKPSMETV